ncbi:fructosamine kinase family protein [Seonamhaeicola sp. MEBiC1930]|uniref:fructosamine kinase family protein n=1 Tax=Seonamhaeicola sp. MEBiC01930 TaxID=2976768 RepID=UPI0032456AB3
MNKILVQYFENFLNQNIETIQSVSGGDISEAIVIKTDKQKYFVKTNTLEKYHMFKTEALGLQAIAATKTIDTPIVYAFNTIENVSFILMEWIETKQPSSKDFEVLGNQLAQLHQSTSKNFGFNTDNHIGSLPQKNTVHNTWASFYTHERLLPQLEMAKQKGLLSDSECPLEKQIINQTESLFHNIKPSLLHGDLWSGNYLISKDGKPYLIDPAVYYGHNEVDIAMTKLFGGFGEHFYESYFSHYPSNADTSARIDLYQLYYLLVHLNLFGSSYYGSVKSILQKYL